MTQRRRSLLFLLLVLGLLAASVVAIVVKPTTLGLDLRGGSEVIAEGKPTPSVPDVDRESLERAVSIIRDRVDSLGVAEPEIQTQGGNQIVVALPGVTNAQVLEDLVQPAELAFYEYWSPTVVSNAQLGGGIANEAGVTNLRDLVFAAQKLPAQPNVQGSAAPLKPWYYKFRKDAAKTLLAGPASVEADLTVDARGRQIDLPKNQEILRVPAGYRVLYNDDRVADAAKAANPLAPEGRTYQLFLDKPAATGDKVTAARPFLESGSQWVVQLDFNETGDQQFEDLTKAVSRRGRLRGENQFFAIRLDNELISTPFVEYDKYPNGISGGGQISNLTVDEARTLANQIESGALPIGLEIVSRKEISATLGEKALRKALIAGAIGLALVALFLVLYYRVLGAIAVAALAMYGVLLYAVIELVPITLTLPGIAGIILTIGVAADANVVIFERVREEARAGRSAGAAIANGYKKGISAIIDANVVTLITAAIIFLLATGGPKGFAFSLFVGVCLSLFTAVLATSAVFGILQGTKLMENERLLGLQQREIRWKIDFVGKWKLWAWLTVVPMVIGAVFIGVNGVERGLDFTSGTKMELTFPEGKLPTEAQLRTVLDELKIGEAKIQATTNSDTGDLGFTLTTKVLTPGETERLESQLDTRFGAEVPLSDTVGAAFGRQLIRSAIVAILLSFIVIILYLTLRFEYKLAIPAIVCVIHDVWLCVSVYAITGREVTGATVAALLTILGYSLYDVVIVFDRIRENLPNMRHATYRQIVNRSLHETLTRSIITAALTTVPVVILYFFGGETLKDFSFALLVGILAGGISSLIIAAPLAALWKEREPDGKKRAAKAARKAARIQTHDADVVDVEALARAEAALAAEPVNAIGDPVGLDGGVEDAVEPARAAAEPPPAQATATTDPNPETPAPPAEPAATDGGDTPPASDAPSRPERERRHRQVQRKRRR